MNEKTECEFNSKLILESLACGDPYLRRNFIGASDAPIIMGVSPWKTPVQLYNEKIGAAIPQQENEYMARGTHLESEARNKFEEIMESSFPAKRFFSKKYDWMMASLDGFNELEEAAVEIKCPGKKSHSIAKSGVIPDVYIPQLQHQMFVCDIKKIYYFSYVSADDYFLLVCKRDDDYIEKLIEKELEFWNCLCNMSSPEMTNRDFEVKDDFGWETLCSEWKQIQKDKKKLLESEEIIKKYLIITCENKNCVGSNVRVQKIKRQGAIDYSKIFELSNVDLEKYRKEESEYWKITLIDDED
jgi:putative phage-type endonuclease